MRMRALYLKATFVLLGVSLPAGLCASAQGPDAGAMARSCSLEKGVYTCSWKEFRQTIDAAKTVAIETGPVDPHTNDVLSSFAGKLGKTVVPVSETPADLTFLLIPLNNTGSFFGSADQDIATLRIYTSRNKGRPGLLIWAENYRGQEDMPWPSVVHYLLDQFQDRLKKR